MWKGEFGQSFKLPTLISQSSDFVAPLNGLAGFNFSTVRHSGYSQTLFRLPLRTQASGLSDNTYDTRKLLELLDALREEAKYLLLFLKSVYKIEVVQISRHGRHSTSFCVEIARASFDAVKAKRDSFMRQLRQAYAMQPYKISNVISFTVKFSVVVTDNNSRKNQASTSNWLLANCVGSADPAVQAAAAKQRTFPWVGAALELGDSSAGGRIFCFLPMPVETSSGLPIHVNGTFGLNDERRTLKWPGIERRNDPTANWNKTLVSQLLPPCYAMLLTEAKKHLSPEQFYKAWPDVNIVRNTQFPEILQPLFTALFRQAVVWTERTEALQQVGNWVLISQATFISEGSSLPSVMKKVLSSCGVQLVTIPTVMWQAIGFAKVGLTEVSPRLARFNMRSHPNSYTSVDQYGKRVILSYCLSDNCYSDLSGLNLLPLANGTFTSFDSYYGGQTVYFCSTYCPRSLLPNLDHLLVDLSDDQELQMSLYQVAVSQQTRLRVLTEREVASLLPQGMPSNWRNSSLVSMPHSQLTFTWLQTFWNWLKNKNLALFSNQLLLPCYGSTSNSTSSFYLTRLSSSQPVVYVSSYTSCPNNLLSALYKMNVRVCLQSEFNFVQHRNLSGYVRYLDTNNVLDAVDSQASYRSAVFSTDEADSLRAFLISGSYTPTSSRITVLKNLAIFTSASNSHSQLYSVSLAASQSVSRQALGEPSNCAINLSNLPPNLILLSRGNYHQLQLLQALKITFPTDYGLLVNYIFPLISNRTLSDHLIDSLMTEALDMFQVLNSRERSSNLSSSLQSLSFVKTIYGRKSPAELFNPLNDEIAALYREEDVFPQSPYNSYERIEVLKICGLRTSVTPQQLLDTIYSISSSASSYPQHVSSTSLSRAKAVLEYISKPSFYRQISGYYTLPNTLGRCSFSDALKRLTTNRSWLPVLSDGPSGYCDELSWKGSGYSSHFISLSSSVVVLTSSTAHALPHLVGSQVYFVTPTVSPQIAAMLPTDSASIAQLVVAHFREILTNKYQISVEKMDSIVHRVYSYLNNTGTLALRQLYSVDEWIFIKRDNKFISPAVVALNQNPTFRQNLEPYIYILPDSLSRYTALFGSGSGVNQAVSQDQIVSVLGRIKEEADAVTQRTTVQEAWDVVMSILNWLTSNGNKKVDPSIDPHVPVETESEWPKLVTASEVVYTDNDFVKNYLQSSDEKDDYTFVHESVSSQLAQALRVVPLTEFLDISEDTFEDAGQHEPLTTRLRNILRDYKDGLTIIKELLQNADDAEATEVNICYDARQHKTNHKQLFFSGMAGAHGPALVVHNNKTFSDDDFSNITKLAAATKQEKVLKIGKFGIGFCSVYHMTDVPSFISRDKFFIFDPTLSYLKKEIKNPGQPGKKTTFTNKIISSSDQLSPYDGLFGFNRSEYEGTMFRLPFRTHASELSGTCYTEATVQELISAIKESSTNLLLFLQHVRTITFHRIDPGQTTTQIVLKVTRAEMSPSLSLSLPIGTVIQELSCTASADSKSCRWLVSQVKEDHLQKYYTASVACPLSSSDYKVNSNFEGEIFCFLPLSQRTGLPVHVSSNFAVINNRRGIWTSDKVSSQTDEILWNVTLMERVIPKAYHNLLLALKHLVLDSLLEGYTFHSLWPLESNLQQHNPWLHMVKALYQLIAQSSLFYSDYSKSWLSINECKFLETGILSSDSSHSLDCVLAVLQTLGLPTVDLSVSHRQMFGSCEMAIVGEATFIKLFFDNLSNLKEITEQRNLVIRHMLEVYTAEYDDNTGRKSILKDYLQNYSCIPCTPDGTVFRACSKVIDPRAKLAQLFDESESYFPIKDLSERHLAMDALLKMGMISTSIPWGVLIERAQTVPQLYQEDREKALRRVNLIVNADTSTEREASAEEITLDSVPFLPVIQSPPGVYPLGWRGTKTPLLCGNELVRDRYGGTQNSLLAGTRVAFLYESQPNEGGCGRIPEKMMRVLNIRKEPTIDDVIHHLKELIEYVNCLQEMSDELIGWTTAACEHIYMFLNNKLRSARSEVHYHFRLTYEQEPPSTEEVDLSPLAGLPCVWTGKEFVKAEVVKKNWSMCGPYIHSLPSSLSNLTLLTEALGIKDELTFEDIQQALGKMRADFGDRPVNKQCQELLTNLVSPLLKLVDESSPVGIALPGEDFVMYPSTELAYNDAPWAPKDDQYLYVNNMIPRELARNLGVNPMRGKMLERFVNPDAEFGGVPFGQHEKLTQRIQNILHDYPFDITILKELLQNADDAKATKMFFILDKRTHGTRSILSEKWANLQGPALLVWNDQEFTERDLKGIQQLGLGSKRSDQETIGQYGIGFNVVYHLTDCPSFITGGETMCVLDPHCEYVYGAREDRPGMRYDKLKPFWEKFPDMKRTYLLEGLSNAPDFSKGSLFRFPLRSTEALVKKSRILNLSTCTPSSLVITASKMNTKLTAWAPEMKKAMLFLNYVQELQFFIIEENDNVLIETKHFQAFVEEAGQELRDTFHTSISAFTQERGSVASVIKYPLTISDITPHAYKPDVQTERWLIQQGIGDIENENQNWKFIKTAKPRHGIAAPLEIPKKAVTTSIVSHRGQYSKAPPPEKFSGQLFCFLPLPVRSKLPVHVNGNFALHSNRRDLWHPTTPGEVDPETEWNHSLLLAIASSYANFLEKCQTDYVPENSYPSHHDALKDVDHYYEVFPSSNPKDIDEPYIQLAKSMYKTLLHNNACVLAVVATIKPAATEDEKDCFCVEWHPIRGLEGSAQVYFWRGLNKELSVILESIGMKLTKANRRIQEHFNAEIEDKAERVQHTTPETVFNYYSQHSSQASETGDFPCLLANTAFKTVETFKVFLKYVLQNNKENPKILEFPEYPFGCPVLLTADESLRELSETNKVIRSKFSHLFPKSSKSFLHPELFDIAFSRKLFVCVNDPIEDGTEEVHAVALSIEEMPEYTLVKHVLTKEIPDQLQDAQVCRDFESLLPKQQLKSLWECFKDDETFKFFCQILVKQLALLPAINGCLYSTSSQIVPAYPIDTAPPQISHFSVSNADLESGFNTLKQLGLPFLDTSLLCGASVQSCPTLHDADTMLKYLCCLHERDDLSEQFTKEVVLVLIDYFKVIDFKIDHDSCSLIKSLPLFENIDGTFTTLKGKTPYVWPSKVCRKGYQKWLKKYDTVFLKSTGDWTKLGSPEQLQIKELSAAQVYTNYIFPALSQLDETERYEHLGHIKDKLIDEYIRLRKCQPQVSHDEVVCQDQASKFLNDLMNLECIGGNNEQLRPVRDFCNHQFEVFQVFRTHFRFLPEKLKEKSDIPSWLSFFETIGLKVNLTQDECLNLCREVSRGQHKELSKASQALIGYLFSEDVREKLKWHNLSRFLQTLADIPFVCTEDISKYEWICPPAKPCSRVRSGDKQMSMTRFNKAALLNDAVLLWTVKSVIALPGYRPYLRREEDQQILKQLQVTQAAEVSHVIENIQNICKATKLANQQLFDNYPEILKKPIEGEELIAVMSHQFQFLNSKETATVQQHYSTLASLPCIPVYTTVDSMLKWQVVLVKPCSVVSCGKAEIKPFHPFLHYLPPKLSSIDEFLEKIGVQRKLGLSHLQIVLEAAFNVSRGDELDENTKRCVVEAVKLTYKLLEAAAEPATSPYMIKQAAEKVLHPLYLPTTEDTLALSTDTVYADDPSYRTSMLLDLSETPYKVLSMEQALYGFSDASFCGLLPDSLRPTGLSIICSMQIAFRCEFVADSELAKRVKTSLKVEAVGKGCLSAVQAITHRKGIYEALETQIIDFLTNTEVKTVNRLKTSVVLIDSDREVGEALTSCFLHASPAGSVLYVSSKLEITDEEPYKLLLDHVMLIIEKQNISDANLREIEGLLGMVLKAQSGDRVREILVKRGYDLEGVDIDEVEFELGSEIPQCWSHRLDQSPDSVFHSGEKVGYQKALGTVIFAEILDPVLPEGCSDFENVSSIEMSYKIFVNSEDEDGIVVSVLDLYKFLRSLQETNPQVEDGSSDSGSVLPYDGDKGDFTRKKLRREDIEDIKRELIEQLDCIWRLPEDEKQKAIKRFYLKWHPDRSPENQEIVEELFKFLLAEIDCRGNARLQRAHWDSEAKTHGFYWRSEFSQGRELRRGSGWGGGGGGRRRRYARYYPPFDRQNFQIRGNKVEGRRWFQQAEVDTEAMQLVFDGLLAKPQVAATVCFLAHQVAEKALKAGKFYVCGLTDNALKITQLITHAYGLQHELPREAAGLADLVSPMDDYYQRTRYPHHCDAPSIPAEEFSVDQATTAVHNAREILMIVRRIVE